MCDHLLICLESSQLHPFTRFRTYGSPVVHVDITKDNILTEKLTPPLSTCRQLLMGKYFQTPTLNRFDNLVSVKSFDLNLTRKTSTI